MSGSHTYVFDRFRLQTGRHELCRDGKPVALEPKAFAVLTQLLAHEGELLARDTLLDAVWGHRYVTPGVLSRSIAQLRRVLEDDCDHPHYIQTVHALGYRFIAPVRLEGTPVTNESVALTRGFDCACGCAGCRAGSGRACGQSPRGRTAVREHERRSGTGVFQRWHHRGHHHRAVALAHARRAFARGVVPLSRRGGGRAAGSEGTGGALHRRR
jgi:DNA-binding winged helix-turn-helix (wHTH) protein